MKYMKRYIELIKYYVPSAPLFTIMNKIYA